MAVGTEVANERDANVANKKEIAKASGCALVFTEMADIAESRRPELPKASQTNGTWPHFLTSF